MSVNIYLLYKYSKAFLFSRWPPTLLHGLRTSYVIFLCNESSRVLLILLSKDTLRLPKFSCEFGKNGKEKSSGFLCDLKVRELDLNIDLTSPAQVLQTLHNVSVGCFLCKDEDIYSQASSGLPYILSENLRYPSE